MDETANPCEDFYRYSCKNWMKDVNLDSYGENDTFSDAEYKLFSTNLIGTP